MRRCCAVIVVSLASLPAVAGDDPALDVKCRELGKKLVMAAKLTELGVKPFQQAPDDVRKRFFEKHGDLPFTEENRAFFASLIARKDAVPEVRALAVRWLGKLSTNKTATKTLIDLLADRQAGIRAAAAEALVEHRDPGRSAKVGKLLIDPIAEVRLAAARSVGQMNDRQQVAPLIAAYKKFARKDDEDVAYGEALALLGEQKISLEIAAQAFKSRQTSTRLAAVRALEANPTLKVIPILMDNLALELRRTITLDPRQPNWDVIYVTMCTELQRRTGKVFGNDVIAWHHWWEMVRSQYMAPPPVFDADIARRWLETYRKMGPSTVKE